MPAPADFLTGALRAAVSERFGDGVRLDAARFVQRNKGGSEYGDLQVNAAFGLAKQLKRNPTEIAGELAEAIDAAPVFAPGEVSGKAFVNFRISDEWLAAELARRAAAPGELLAPAAEPEKVLVDFSSPNVAKAMHVGHLRTTVIGDSICRLFEARGHAVDRVSHVGDWGTQFGMLIRRLQDVPDPASLSSEELTGLYKDAKDRFDADEAFRDESRQRVVDLQAGDEQALALWRLLCENSRSEFADVYERLDIEVREVGESFYQPMLAGVVADLEALGLVVVDDGAKCVFVDGFTTRDGDPLPLIVQKADGGYNYATTDLAAVRYRVEQGLKRILYVIDNGQSQHMAMVHAVARKAGWLPDDVEAVHVPFGLVLGEDRKRMRTRSGDTVSLRSLLDEAEERGRRLAAERGGSPEIGSHLGLSAIKYAELAHNRMTDYVFSFDKMVSLEGNTAPYMLYAYARINGIVGKAASHPPVAGSDARPLDADERALAKLLVDFEDVVDRATAEYQPSDVTEYLFGLSQEFNRFYERARVVDDVAGVDLLRLRLVEVTAATLRAGLGLLGVRVLDRI